jgi:CRISPR/Cas system-associated protein Cas5 (RAMP superfamily)
MKEQEDILKKISKLKATLYEKNNSFKLSDGRTIQDAIIDNTYLRRLKSSYDNMLKYKDSKKRITEVNNSYFDCYEVNYDSDEIRKKSKTLEKQIQRTDFEISKLNSIEFEISL